MTVKPSGRCCANDGTEQPWVNDVESLGYMFLYYAHGSLPWQGPNAASAKEKNELIKEKKRADQMRRSE